MIYMNWCFSQRSENKEKVKYLICLESFKFTTIWKFHLHKILPTNNDDAISPAYIPIWEEKVGDNVIDLYPRIILSVLVTAQF